VLKFGHKFDGVMSRFKLSGKGGIKIGVFRPIFRFISKKKHRAMSLAIPA